MSTDSELSNAEAKSRAARAQLTATLVDIQARLNPRQLLREAVEEVRDGSVELLKSGLSKARAHPGPVLGIVVTLAAFLARDWFTTHARPASEGGHPAAPPDTAETLASQAKPRRIAKRKTP